MFRPTAWRVEPEPVFLNCSEVREMPGLDEFVVQFSTRKGHYTSFVPKLSSNCLESQWEWVRDLVAGWFQDEPYLSMELRIISSLRIQAVRASFFGLPADNRRW